MNISDLKRQNIISTLSGWIVSSLFYKNYSLSNISTFVIISTLSLSHSYNHQIYQ
jgi:hypothetical protein